MKKPELKLKQLEPTDAFILRSAKEVLSKESSALKTVAHGIGGDFIKGARLMLSARGKIVTAGVGKSGLIARKIASTLSSTGTPSVYIHPVESLHGDLGLISEGDIILALSYSGETEETVKFAQLLNKKGLKIISITNTSASKLANVSAVTLSLGILKEACPYNIVPTSSTTAMLALGDALAITLMRAKGFNGESFAKLHPGGNLGKLLNLKVSDLMRTGRQNPVILSGSTLRKALAVMTTTRAGAVSIITPEGRLAGFFTDGDIRRSLGKGIAELDAKIDTMMTKRPTFVYPDTMAIDAANLISAGKFDNLPVIDAKSLRPVGIIDEKDLLKAGLL